MNLSFAMLLILSGVIDKALNAPPYDLASLLDPVQVLTAMQAPTDEDGLIALLTANAAQLENGTDATYLRRLMAIRRLESLRSNKALPALATVAQGDDLTLAAAAEEAAATIQDKPVMIRGETECVKGVAKGIPPDAAFAIIADLETGRQSRSLSFYLDLIRESTQGQPNAALMVMGLNQGAEKMQQGIAMTLQRLGNLRIDAVAVVFSGSLGVREQRDNAYVTWILKGFFDPARLVKAMQRDGGDDLQRHDILGREVWTHGRQMMALCALDECTLIISLGRDRTGMPIVPVLQALLTDGETAVPAAIRPAVEAVAAGKTRLAGSGAFSEAQRLQMRADLSAEVERMQQRREQQPQRARKIATQTAILELLMRLTRTDHVTGMLKPGGAIEFVGKCPDEPLALELDQALADVDTTIREMLKTMQQEMGMMLGPAFGTMLDKPLWQVERDETDCRLTWSGDGHALLLLSLMQRL